MLSRRVLVPFLAALTLLLVVVLVGHKVFRTWRQREAHRTLEQRLYARLAQDNMITAPDSPFQLFVSGVQGKVLLRPILKWKSANGDIDMVIRSEDGELHVEPDKDVLYLHLREVNIWGADGHRAWFAERIWELELPEILKRL